MLCKSKHFLQHSRLKQVARQLSMCYLVLTHKKTVSSVRSVADPITNCLMYAEQGIHIGPGGRTLMKDKPSTKNHLSVCNIYSKEKKTYLPIQGLEILD